MHSALEELSAYADYSMIKSSDGAINVYLGGQTALVLGDHQFAITADFTTPQTRILDSLGGDVTAQITRGSLGAVLQDKNTTLPGYLNSLNGLARTLADSTNAALSQGLDKNGNPPASTSWLSALASR